jgi:hypothetical protein
MSEWSSPPWHHLSSSPKFLPPLLRSCDGVVCALTCPFGRRR